jgi:hypothetical protein
MSSDLEAIATAESLLALRDLTAAKRWFCRAEAGGTDPDRCAAGRWMASMLSADFEGAWRESDRIRHRGGTDSNVFWNGEQWSGKRVIIRCLHGYGDTVQFLRYAEIISRTAAHLTVECAPHAADLVRCISGIDDVVTWEEKGSDWQRQMEVMELPYIFRTKLIDLPVATDYLHLPSAALDCAALALGSKAGMPRIGMVWSAGEWNPSRSIPFELLMPLFARREFEFWNLQGGADRQKWQVLSGAHFRDTALLADAGLLPLATVVAHLDLVITVDTLAAHLAGALGIPCFLMLQYAADWRWMIDRNDSPWYPSVRLFRQPSPGQWLTVVGNVDQVLSAAFGTPRQSVLAV